VFENALGPLALYKKTAIQFLVPSYIGKLNEWDLRDGETAEPLMDTEHIRDWLRAGHSIGSHSLTHARLTRLTLRDAREEIFASKKKLEDDFAVAIEHFCYPYGDWNEPVRDLVVEAGSTLRPPRRWPCIASWRAIRHGLCAASRRNCWASSEKSKLGA